MNVTPEQRKQLRQKWVEALRSGKYRQTTAYLETENGHCCLGVACRVFDAMFPGVLDITQEKGKGKGKRKRVATLFGAESAVLPEVVQKAMGLRTSTGMCDTTALDAMNDNGTSFAQIADLIESNPPGLFIDE